MKLIIAGGRHFRARERDFERLDALDAETPVDEVVSGCARGADWWGEVWAQRRKIPVRHFAPAWNVHGLKAGPMRNKAMAEYADAVVLFPGDRGTASMFEEATKAGIVIHDWRTTCE